MSSASAADRKWNQRCSAEGTPHSQPDATFRLLFERSADAIWLFDPASQVFVDCNQAAVDLMRAGSKGRLLLMSPAQLSPEFQPDGQPSSTKAAQVAELTERQGNHRFEWVARRFDGTDVPLEVLTTPVVSEGRTLHVVISRDITQRKQAAEEIQRLNASLERRVAERTAELQAIEERLRTLIEHAPEAIVVFDGDSGRFLNGNGNACRLYGLSPEELIRKTPADVSPEYQPNGRRSDEMAREFMQRAIAGEVPVFDWLHRHARGRVVPCEVRLVRIPSMAGHTLLRASIIDNTERRRRDIIQQAVYHISEAVHTAVDLNSLYAEFHGIVMGLMPAQNFYIALFDPVAQTLSFDYHVDEATETPEPLPLNTGLTSYVLRTGKPLLVDREMSARKRITGNTVTFEGYEGISYIESGVPAAIWLGVPLTVQGRVIGVMAVQDYHDPEAYGVEEERILSYVAAQTALAIDRKRAEQALRDSEEKFRALFEASIQGVILHDEEKMIEVNPAALRMLGFSREEDVLGKHPSQISSPMQPGGVRADELARQHIQNCMTKGSARFEWLTRTAQGEDFPIEVILTRIQMGGRFIIQAVIDDIRERKRAEAELLKSLQREKELHALKTSFVSLVSHEFRTPLGIIQSSSEILHDYFDRLEPAERCEHLDSIRKSTRRMADLMEEVLLLSRIEAGKMDFQPAPFDLARFCRRLTDEMLSATHRRCPIELDLGTLPETGRADERLLRHIFTNLITNAVKYSEPGVTVRFSVVREGPEAVFRVQDRGIGIPETDREWLFHAFHRGRNVGQRPGTGLGLVIVKRCLELHGGRIEVTSAVGEGTTMTVRMKLFE